MISIITINYNNLAGLQLTMDSVFKQSYGNFEYIVVDGGSTDGSVEHIKSLENKLTYWVSEPDRGVYDAMNKGIAVAQGDYLLFLNSGDHFNEYSSLKSASACLNRQDIVYFDLTVVKNENSFIKSYPNKLSFAYFIEDTLPHPGAFIHKTVFDKVGSYDDDLKIVSDWKFFMDAICKHGISYRHVPLSITTFYIGGLSSDPSNYDLKINEKRTILENEYEIFYRDIEDLIKNKSIVYSLKSSRIVDLLIKLKFLNRF